METNEKSKKALDKILKISLIFSIINYSAVLLITLLAITAPGNKDFLYIIYVIIAIIINLIYLLSIYLEFKAYKTGKGKYLILPFIISFVTITPPILATIIKLILLITIALLIKKTSKENDKILYTTKKDQNNN